MLRISIALACAAISVPVAVAGQTADAPSKAIKLSKVVFDPEITKDHQRVKVGTVCLFSGQPLNFGSSQHSLDNERFERLFAADMTKHGFHVIAAATNLFDSEDDAATADYLIGAKLHITSVDICDSVNGLKGKISVSVEWQLYDRSQKKVVETVTTEGTGQLPKFSANGLTEMIDGAFTASIDALIDQGVVEKHLGKPAPVATATP